MDTTKREPHTYAVLSLFGGSEPSVPPSANCDSITEEARITDTNPAEKVSSELTLTEDELAILRKYQRTVVATDAVECKIILIGHWTLNNQYEEEAEVKV